MGRTLSDHFDPKKGPKRILALDGGGTLGIIEIAFLEKIEELLRARAGGDPNFRLCDYFDLIGGTSTGAIIATALALGMSVADVKTLYFRLAPSVFKGRWLPLPGYRPRFSEKGLARELDKVIGDRELASADLKTGLAIMMKRLDTASPWVVTNNPQAKYWGDPAPDPITGKRPHIGNKNYRIADLVRASTAAPFYFAPHAMRIVETEPQGLFVDGGVSPHNNPALQLLMLAGMKGYALNWAVGKDQLLLISIGAGWRRPKLSVAQCNRMSALELAVRALRGVAWDAQVQSLKILQWISEPRRPWPIDTEVSALQHEILGAGEGGGRELISFQRYDVMLDPAWIARECGMTVGEPDVVRIDDFVNPRIMKDAYEIAAKAAASQVHSDDFPARFDMAR
jgi:hypothetical protein